MHFSVPLLSLAVAVSSLHSCQASPVKAQINGADAVARSMMGPNSNAVSWESLPLERSPSDPESEMESRELDRRVVYNPPITYPKSGTVWTAGDQKTVQWKVDQEQIPVEAKNYKAVIKLGYVPADGSGGLNLKWTLADNFPITEESMDVTLPADLETRDDYIIVLMGDSGNQSKKFTINAQAAKSSEQANRDSDTGAQEQEQAAASHHSAAQRSNAANDDESDFVRRAHDSMLGRDISA